MSRLGEQGDRIREVAADAFDQGEGPQNCEGNTQAALAGVAVVVGMACVVVRVVPMGMTLVGVVLLRAVGLMSVVLVGMVLVRVILMLCWVAAGMACTHARSMPLIAITAKRRDSGRAAVSALD